LGQPRLKVAHGGIWFRNVLEAEAIGRPIVKYFRYRICVVCFGSICKKIDAIRDPDRIAEGHFLIRVFTVWMQKNYRIVTCITALQVTPWATISTMTASILVLVAPVALLAGAVLELLFSRVLSSRGKGILAALAALPALLAVLAFAPIVSSGRATDLSLGSWDGPLQLAFHVDALSVLFAFMGTALGGAVLLYSIGYMAAEKATTRFFSTMLLFIAAFVALVYSSNLFVFYLCWELVGLCSFSLVGFWYTNDLAVKGARKVLLMTHIAGYALLAAIIALYLKTGTAVWTSNTMASGMTTGIFLLMLVALIAKSVQFPLHTWIPEAMAAPTPVSALLHAACYVKAGVYLAARMHSFVVWPQAWGTTLIWVGTVTMAIGVMYAMVQTDLKRMLAFSTVSQIGYMMLGIGIGTPLALAAALLHCLNHGFFKGGLFLTAGAVQHATGTRDMNRLGGLAQKMPGTTLSWMIGVGSMMGIPLMSGFASKWMLYAAALESGWAVPAMVAWAVSLGTVFLGAKATSAVFLGPITDDTQKAHDASPTMLWGMGLMAFGSVVLGIAPQLAVNLLMNPVLAAYGVAPVRVTWLGLSAGAGSFSTVGGMVLAIVSIVLGGAVYWIARASRMATVGSVAMVGAGGGIFTGGEPLEDDDRLTAADFSAIFEDHWSAFFHWTKVDEVYLSAWRALHKSACMVQRLFAKAESCALGLLLLFTAVFGLVVYSMSPATTEAVGLHHAVAMPALLIVSVVLAAVALFVVSLVTGEQQRIAMWPCALIVGGAAIAGLCCTNSMLRVGLLEVAALFTVLRVSVVARTLHAKLLYGAVVGISALAFCSAEYFELHGAAKLATTSLLIGILVKLAILPFSYWLLKMAEELPVLVLALILCVVDIATFGELWMAAQMHPEYFSNQGLLICLAAGTALVAGLLMLAQPSLKRLLVLSSIEDAGFLLFGLASATTMGSEGAIAAAATHAVAKVLLFLSLAQPEKDGALQTDARGLAARYPVSAFGFLIGMLAMLGVPPMMGFVGRWRLYATAFSLHPLLLFVFIVASVMPLIAYVLALTKYWWGSAEDSIESTSEPFVLKFVVCCLAISVVLLGVWPQIIGNIFGGGL